MALPSVSKSARALHDEEAPPKGILIEYFSDAVRLSHSTVTEEIAITALEALHHVHTAYVEHGDIHRRNILLLPGGRVVWIDFDGSATARNEEVRRQDLFLELMQGWSYMYGRLVCRSLLQNKLNIDSQNSCRIDA